jgi:hypothetical protein
MAAVASMKPGGQHAVQQTFPYVFQQDFQAGTGYFPSVSAPPMNLMVGETFQSEYHNQKRKDAVQSVYNGLQNDRSKELKLLTGTANYHLPKPVLGQRIFANPSLGAGSDSSARRDGSTAPWTIVQNQIPTIQTVADVTRSMHGGVMRTREGFDYYTTNLRARIDQFNAMNSLASGMPVPRGATTRPISDSRNRGPIDKVEFFLLLQTLQDSITQGDLTRFTLDNLKKMMSVMFRFGPTAEKEDFQDMLRSIENIRLSLEQGISETAGEENGFQDQAYAETLTVYMEGLNSYVDEMFANMNMSEMDRTTLSNSLIKTLGFSRLQNMDSSREMIRELRKGNERVNQVAEDFDDDFDDGPDGGDGHFNHPAEAREDEDQAGVPRAPFAGNGGDPNRGAYGAERAPGAREQEFAYFGASVADQPAMVQPLVLAGVEGLPVPDINAAQSAINAAIDDLLPEAAPGETRMQVLAEQIAGGTYTDADEFAEQVAIGVGDALPVADVIEALRTFEGEFPGVFDSFIARNPTPAAAPQYAVGAAAPPPPPPPAPAAAAAPDQSAAQRLPLGVRNRTQLKNLSDAQLRQFGRELPEEFGGPYNAREGTKSRVQRIALIRKISDVVPGF